MHTILLQCKNLYHVICLGAKTSEMFVSLQKRNVPNQELTFVHVSALCKHVYGAATRSFIPFGCIKKGM